MFKKKEENKTLVQIYYYYRRLQRILLAIAVLINILFIAFVAGEGSFGVFFIFALNLYVAGSAYWEFMQKQKKHKEKNPDVK